MSDEGKRSKSLERKSRGRQLGDIVVQRVLRLHRTKADAKESSAAKGLLAVLRRSVYADHGTIPELWEVTAVPEELQPHVLDDAPTRAEASIHAALCLYARHEQGKSVCMHNKDVPFAMAVYKLAHPTKDKEVAGVRARLNAAATAVSFQEFVRHIASLVSMMRGAGIGFNYGELTRDLYEFHCLEGRDVVRLRWARSYHAPSRSQESDSTTQDRQGA